MADPPNGPLDPPSFARKWIALLLAAGVAWRLTRYGLGFPLWGDEAVVMLNVVERHGYADLLRPLDRGQVASPCPWSSSGTCCRA